MNHLLLDIRHALRSLKKDPGYAAVAVLLFALGIGANTAIFSVANSVLLRPLPYQDPERLVVTLHQGNAPVSPADYLDYKKSVPAFQQMAAAQMWGATLTGGDRPERIPGLAVSANTMSLLGVQPMLGRWFRPEEEHGGQSKVVLLSYQLWQQRFGSSRDIVGKNVLLDNAPYVIAGIMPEGFRFAPFWATRAQMWTPLVLDNRVQDRDGRSLRVFARLRPGVTYAQAQSQMDAVAANLAKAYPQTNANLSISVVPLKEKVVRSVRPTIFVLLATVGFVLLIACVTVGNLALARAVARRKEMALRLALGARARDLVRGALVEVLLLAMAGCAGGVLLGSWAVDLLLATLPAGSVPRLAEISFDRSGLAFAAVLAVVSALLAGLIPAWQATQTDLNTGLKEAARGNTQGSGRVAGRSLLVAVAVALSLVLMAGAGLMTRTMMSLAAVDAGFNPQHLVTMQVALSGTDYDREGRRANVFRGLRERLAALPGVEAVSAINHLPIAGDLWRLNYSIAGEPVRSPGNQLSAVYRVAMPGYFRTMQTGLLAGRDFQANDNGPAATAAIINESMAKRRWPNQSALGKVITFGTSPQDQAIKRLVVGVVKDVRQDDWTSAPQDEIYLPYDQRPDSMGLSYLTFVMRVRGAPEGALNTAIGAVRGFDKSLTISEAATMNHIIADKLWQQRLATSVMGGFATIALLLAAVGIYGVVSHSMRQRVSEIGVRMALGAKGIDVIRLALREGMRPVVFGVVGGALLALALSRFMSTLLYGVGAADPLTFLSIAVFLMLVCFSANLIPAVRATRIDPLSALRHE